MTKRQFFPTLHFYTWNNGILKSQWSPFQHSIQDFALSCFVWIFHWNWSEGRGRNVSHIFEIIPLDFLHPQWWSFASVEPNRSSWILILMVGTCVSTAVVNYTREWLEFNRLYAIDLNFKLLLLPAQHGQQIIMSSWLGGWKQQMTPQQWCKPCEFKCDWLYLLSSVKLLFSWWWVHNGELLAINVSNVTQDSVSLFRCAGLHSIRTWVNSMPPYVVRISDAVAAVSPPTAFSHNMMAQ